MAHYNEIDVLIGTKIMNWTKEILPNNDEGLPYTAEYWTEFGEKRVPANFFNPSTNLVDAWKVVEKLKEEKWTKILVSKFGTPLCRVGIYDNEDSEVQVVAETVPLVICLAALKSVGIEVGKDE